MKALAIIGNLTAVPEIGKTYLGKVVRLAEFGAFVELFPGTDGYLLHISEIAEHRVKEVKDELREGDQVMVKVLAIEGNRIQAEPESAHQGAEGEAKGNRLSRRMKKQDIRSRQYRRPRRQRRGPQRRVMSSTSASQAQTRARFLSRAETTSTNRLAAWRSTRQTSRTSTAWTERLLLFVPAAHRPAAAGPARVQAQAQATTTGAGGGAGRRRSRRRAGNEEI